MPNKSPFRFLSRLITYFLISFSLLYISCAVSYSFFFLWFPITCFMSYSLLDY